MYRGEHGEQCSKCSECSLCSVDGLGPHSPSARIYRPSLSGIIFLETVMRGFCNRKRLVFQPICAAISNSKTVHVSGLSAPSEHGPSIRTCWPPPAGRARCRAKCLAMLAIRKFGFEKDRYGVPVGPKIGAVALIDVPVLIRDCPETSLQPR